MQYTEEKMEQLRTRWIKPLLDPETGKPIIVEGCKTFQELLTKRLKEIEEILLPKVKEALPEIKKEMLKIEKEPERSENFFKLRSIIEKICIRFDHIWQKNVEEKFRKTMLDIKKYGLKDYKELTDVEKDRLGRNYSIDLRCADLSLMHFEGANLINAYFDGADCSEAHFEWANCMSTCFERAKCIGAHFEGTHCGNTYFKEANCTGARFDGAICGHAHFDGADCSYTHFEKASLRNAVFDGANCCETHFEGADCSRIHFDHADCSVAHFDKAICFSAHFEGADCTAAYFDGAQCYGISFGAAEKIDENGVIHRKPCNLNVASYKNAKFLGVDTSNVDWSKNPGMKSEIEHQQFVHYTKKNARWWQKPLIFLWMLTSNYGKSFWRWLLSCAVIIGGFTFLYSSLNFDYFHISNHIVNPQRWLSYLYFSVVTFSTLGFGDVTPTNCVSMIYVMAEVILGYFMLGGLITFLVKWLGRR